MIDIEPIKYSSFKRGELKNKTKKKTSEETVFVCQRQCQAATREKCPKKQDKVFVFVREVRRPSLPVAHHGARLVDKLVCGHTWLRKEGGGGRQSSPAP